MLLNINKDLRLSNLNYGIRVRKDIAVLTKLFNWLLANIDSTDAGIYGKANA